MRKSTGLLVPIAALALATASPSVAHAQVGGARRFGLGLALGFPDVGISANYFLRERASLQLVVSFWYRYGRFGHDYVDGSRHGGVFLRADYLFHPVTFVRGATADLGLYVGPGLYAGFGSGDSLSIGLELPVGLALHFKTVPLDLTFEAVPRLDVIDPNGVQLDFRVGGTLHCRYYF